MRKFSSQLSSIVFIILVLFVVLFDVEGGVAMGAQIWNTAPPSLIAIAEIFGNLLWLVAIFAWFAGIILFIISFIDEVVTKAMNEAHNEGKLATTGNMTVIGHFWIYTNLMVGILAIGSGFWFSGTGIVVMMLGVMLWRNVVIVARDKKLEELKKESGKELVDIINKHTDDLRSKILGD